MCILFLAVGQHPDYPLIIAANRDEYFAREAKPAAFWSDHPGILAGKDVQSGGSWFGVNKSGRIAAITNFRAPELVRADAMSRGGLVSRYLRGQEHHLAFQNFIETSSEAYNPFNLLYGTFSDLHLYNSVEKEVVELEEGFHCICNGFINDSWPKMDRGMEMVKSQIRSGELTDPNALMNIMRDESLAKVEQLPDTGIGVEAEQKLSSIFIPPTELGDRVYGTRSTTILMCGQETVSFCEFEHTEEGETEGCRHFEIPKPVNT